MQAFGTTFARFGFRRGAIMDAAMGWLALAGIGLCVAALLSLFGLPRGLWLFAASALVLGAAGYAWQGSPRLAAHPVEADTVPIAVDRGLAGFRSAILGDSDDAVFADADAALRRGDADAAGAVFTAALQARPEDSALWSGLGGALAAHDAGQVSPAALFAFRRAIVLAPRQPGPPFMLGLAYIQAGDFASALAPWQIAAALTPRDAPYRTDVLLRLRLVERYLAMPAPDRQAM